MLLHTHTRIDTHTHTVGAPSIQTVPSAAHSSRSALAHTHTILIHTHTHTVGAPSIQAVPSVAPSSRNAHATPATT